MPDNDENFTVGPGYIKRSISDEFARQDDRFDRLEIELRTMREIFDKRLTDMAIAMVEQKASAAGWGAAMGVVFSVVANWLFHVFQNK